MPTIVGVTVPLAGLPVQSVTVKVSPTLGSNIGEHTVAVESTGTVIGDGIAIGGSGLETIGSGGTTVTGTEVVSQSPVWSHTITQILSVPANPTLGV